ncbi:MAG TPA: hypothetical protein VHZ55_25820, partial [Bryobacteraceae bacterium]|nr:hypothetical protein [Bryobacteraceae bacterium]
TQRTVVTSPAIGIGATRRIYAGYFTDRQRRFYLRGLSREGVCFGDPRPIFIDPDDAGWDWDNS